MGEGPGICTSGIANLKGIRSCGINFNDAISHGAQEGNESLFGKDGQQKGTYLHTHHT